MKNEKGFTLIEVVIAIALLGIIASGFLMALSGATKALILADERTTAESLARSQMEDIKSIVYAEGVTSYTSPIPAEHADAGYSATNDVVSLPDPNNPGSDLVGIQKITVKIYHYDDAHVNPPVITLEGYKVDR